MSGIALYLSGWFIVVMEPKRTSSLPPLPYIDAYKSGIDQSLFEVTLRLTPTERLQRLEALQRLYYEARRAGNIIRQSR